MDFPTPCVMGIVNVTPDSFYEKSRVFDEAALLEKVGQMLKNGASIIDVGGMSTRPFSKEVPVKEEEKRIITSIQTIKKHFPESIISIDTYRASVAEKALNAGATIINDISGGEKDENMFSLVSEAHCPYILTHIQGTPETMQKKPTYKNVVEEIIFSLSKKIDTLTDKGIADIIIDPGFGFGKSIKDSYEMVATFEKFLSLGLPVLAGVSRKSMIQKTLDISVEKALNGTTILHTVLLEKGVSILRTHDVLEAQEAISLTKEILLSGNGEI